MKPNYLIHENMYIAAKKAGWDGWGGNERLSNKELVSRFFELDKIPSKGNLLELGCGEGHHSRVFAEHGYNITGIDISSTAISWAKEKSKLTGIKGSFLVADLTNPSLNITEKYTVIVDGNCLHCIIGDDRSTFLNHVYVSLKSNGIFFVSSLCSKDNDNHLIYKNNAPYRHITSEINLITELENTGFTVLKIKTYERKNYDHITVHMTKLN